jgi:hypothetical protein
MLGVFNPTLALASASRRPLPRHATEYPSDLTALLSVFVVLAIQSNLLASTLYNIEQVGLTGTGYIYNYDSGIYQYSEVYALNNAGQADGYSSRYSTSGEVLGQDNWFFNGTTTQQIGLTGPGYSYNDGNGIYQYSEPVDLNNAGQVIGTSARLTSAGGDLGQDTWLYNGTTTQQIGLTGGDYSYNNGSGIVQSSTAEGLNSAGQVIGTSARFTSAGGDLGQDTWLYNGNTTQQIGLTGAGYSYNNGSGVFQESYASGVNLLNNTGQVTGVSNRYTSTGTSTGQGTWLYNGTSTQQIGLIGAGYGYNNGSGIYQYSEVSDLNNAGQADGYSFRYNSTGYALGQDVWFFNGTTTQQIGLTGAGYSYNAVGFGGGVFQQSFPASFGTGTAALNNAGQTIGTSDRFSSPLEEYLGQDSWFFNGTTTQQIGLTGGVYSYNNGIGIRQFSRPVELNDAGQVMGFSYRYSSSGGDLGQDGWVYDSAQNKTYLLQLSVDSATNYSFTQPEVLTSNGDVLGSYELFNGSVDEGDFAFEWSEFGGMQDLGSLVNGGLTAAGWQALIESDFGVGSNPDGSLTYIVGYGGLLNSSGGTAVYVLTADVPEPASTCLLFAASIVVSLRRPTRQKTL